MAIAGFIIHTLPESVATVQSNIATMPQLTSYGVHEETHIIVVAEAPSTEIEGIISKVQALQGVLATYLTSLTFEDETLDE